MEREKEREIEHERNKAKINLQILVTNMAQDVKGEGVGLILNIF